MVDKTIGSSLDAGSIAALNFSGRVWQILSNIVCVRNYRVPHRKIRDSLSHRGQMDREPQLQRCPPFRILS
jgi:hypothetical protein